MPPHQHLWRFAACAALAIQFAVAHTHEPLGSFGKKEALQPPPPRTSWLDSLWKSPLFQFFAPDPEFTNLLNPLAFAPAPPPCSVESLPALSDLDALAFEENLGLAAIVNLEGLTPLTAKALTRFERIVTSAGGSLWVTSAYRPAAYQDHLQAVWDKWMLELRNNFEEGCVALKTEVHQEFETHQLLQSQRPATASDHSLGISVDASVVFGKQRRRQAVIDRLARRAGLVRPHIRRDPVHFRLRAAAH